MQTGRTLHQTIPILFSNLQLSEMKQKSTFNSSPKNEIMIYTNIPTLKAWSLPSKMDRNIFNTVKLVIEQHLNTQRERQRHKTTVKITGSARNVRIKQKRNFLVSTTITAHNLDGISRNFYILNTKSAKSTVVDYGSEIF